MMTEKRRRLGRFRISTALISDNWKSVLPALKGIVVVRAESKWDLDCIEYVGLSDDFEEVELGMPTPEYQAILTKQDDGTIAAKWERTAMPQPLMPQQGVMP